VTGYATFQEAYENKSETRLITDEGIREEELFTEDEEED
jgi:hypothetical protein